MTLTFSNPGSRRAWLASAIAILGILFAVPGFSATQNRRAFVPASTQTPIRAEAALVKIDAAVLDRHSSLVGGLTQNQFRILVDSQPQPILFFSPTDAPARVVVLVETSPAVYLIHNEHLLAAYALLDGLAPGDQAALATYDQSVRFNLGFTTDKSALAAAIAGIQYALGSGDLNFYDSLSALVASLSHAPGKTAIVALTTGLDSSSPPHWDALAHTLRAGDVVVFPVALGGSLRQYTGKKSSKRSKKSKNNPPPADSDPDASLNPLSFARADTALRSIAALTGGRAYFPESAEKFAPDYREIAATLRHQYVLGIAPLHDGQFHSLTVEVLDPAGQPLTAGPDPSYRVLARQGYLAPQP